MANFVLLLKVQLLISAVAIATNKTEISQQIQNKENTVVASFLEKFIKPFLRATYVNPIELNTAVSPNQPPNIVQYIRKRVDQLKPLLDDYEDDPESDNNLTLQGNEDTTVIEFLPEDMRKAQNNTRKANSENNPLLSSINRYKILREQIKKALDEELISKESKSLIMNTLDDMIAQMIESQCTWNPQTLRRFNSNGTVESLQRVQSMTKKQWKQLKQKYIEYLTERKEQENLFMNQFHQFFSTVINETDNLSDRYKIKCQLVHSKATKKAIDRPVIRGMKDTKAKCPNFKVCMEELKEFLTDYYIYLNDTAVSAFRNYAAMYIRDFGVDSKSVMPVLRGLSNNVEKIVSSIYKNELKNFELASNKDKNENIRLISNFLKTTTAIVRKSVKDHLIDELGSQRTRLFMTIKEDLAVNIEVDLENLVNFFIDGFCTKFILCNGRFSARRQGNSWTFRPKPNNEVYVKVQLSLDDQAKEAVIKSGLLDVIKNPEHMKLKFNRKNVTEHVMKLYTRSGAKYNITRTTGAYFEPNTTALMYDIKRHGKKHEKKHGHSKKHKRHHKSRRLNDINDSLKENEVIET